MAEQEDEVIDMVLKEGSQVFCAMCKTYHYVSECFKEVEPNPLRKLINSEFVYCPKSKKNAPALLIIPVS